MRGVRARIGGHLLAEISGATTVRQMIVNEVISTVMRQGRVNLRRRVNPRSTHEYPTTKCPTCLQLVVEIGNTQVRRYG